MLMQAINQNPVSDETEATNEFLHTLVYTMWIQYKGMFVVIVVLPFIVQATICIVFMPHLLNSHENPWWDIPWLERAAKNSFYILASWNFLFYALRMYDRGSSTALTVVIDSMPWAVFLLHDLGIDVWTGLETTVQKALISVAIAFTWTRLFFWLRLFEKTAFFLDLIGQTFTDSNFMAFAMTTGLMILGFTCLFWIFNMNRAEVHENGDLYEEQIEGNEFVNSFLFTYITSMGEYSNNFRGDNEYFLLIIFFAVTLLIQNMFMTMLIAIMSDTFQKVLENKQQSAMKERIKMISDFRLLIKLFDHSKNSTYIFDIRPKINNRTAGILTSVKAALETTTTTITKQQLLLSHH